MTNHTAAGTHADYPVVALVLQGGGALGSYQAGVYQGLAEGGIHPNWVAGISIGALNAAVIAGNAPARRIEQLRAFWETICRQPWWPSLHSALSSTLYLTLYSKSLAQATERLPEGWRIMVDALESARALFEGQNGFFIPRPWPALGLGPRDATSASFYDTGPLRATLEKFADFDRINQPREMRVSVGAVNVRTGNFVYFDSTERRLGPEHFMASAALPPGFPAVEVDGECYWDGGLVSNTPLQQVVSARPRRDALIFQIDLWSASGELPTDLLQVAERQKDIQYSSRTRMVTSTMREEQDYRHLLHEAVARVPEAERKGAWYERAAALACVARRTVIHLIYRDKPYESYAKDFQFGQATMNEHWSSGLSDMRATLEHPEWLAMPTADRPFVTHDLHGVQRA
jgi:NTE family protein